MLLILYVVLLLIETAVDLVNVAGMLDQLLLAAGSGYQPEILLLKSW